MPSEAVVSTHLNTSEEVMKKEQEGPTLFRSGISQHYKILLADSRTGALGPGHIKFPLAIGNFISYSSFLFTRWSFPPGRAVQFLSKMA